MSTFTASVAEAVRARSTATGRRRMEGDGGDHYALTDAGNAEYFAATVGGDLRYDLQRAHWLRWRDPHWERDAEETVRSLAVDAMRARYSAAIHLPDLEARKRAATWALSSESRGRIDALLYFAKGLPPIMDRGDHWDRDPWLLATPSGVVDLRTGALRPAGREDRLTMVTRAPYDPRATSALWTSTLKAILVDDPTIDFFHVAVGYSATGDTRRDCWFLANGSGRNGKNTVLNPIRHALGSYALELPGAVFDARVDRPPYELAALPGKRFVTSSESGDTLRLHHDRLKQLTGGDQVSAAAKYRDAFEFTPTCKLWLSCNKRPRVTDDTVAFWARVCLIPFPVSFAGREDKTLRPTLVDDATQQAAVLAWIVAGATRYAAQGLTQPETVHAATRAYERESDPLADFIDEAIDTGPDEADAEVRAGELYEHYVAWATRGGHRERDRLTATTFGRRMAERFARTKHRDGWAYRGLSRRP